MTQDEATQAVILLTADPDLFARTVRRRLGQMWEPPPRLFRSIEIRGVYVLQWWDAPRRRYELAGLTLRDLREQLQHEERERASHVAG